MKIRTCRILGKPYKKCVILFIAPFRFNNLGFNNIWFKTFVFNNYWIQHKNGKKKHTQFQHCLDSTTIYFTNLELNNLGFNTLEFNEPWIEQTLIKRSLDSTTHRINNIEFNNFEVNNLEFNVRPCHEPWWSGLIATALSCPFFISTIFWNF